MTALISEALYLDRLEKADDFYKDSEKSEWIKYSVGSYVELDNPDSEYHGSSGRIAARTIGPNIVMFLLDGVREPQYASVNYLKLI